jgi:hypothetical protein
MTISYPSRNRQNRIVMPGCRPCAIAVVAVTLLVLLTACGGGARALPIQTRPSPVARSAGGPTSHIVVIMMENEEYGDIIGSRSAPYINTLARRYGLASGMYAVTHPSLPNYLALTAGSTFGVTNDCHCSFPVGGIFVQAALSHLSWTAYAEGMPSPCDRTHGDGGLYTQRHNPPVLYARLSTCATHDLPLGSTASGPLAHALSSRHLANYVFIAPDLCHDMHSCSISSGDAWLAAWIPRIARSYAYRHRSTAILITFDEGSNGTVGNGEVCAAHPTDQSCHVPFLVVSRYVRTGTVVSAPLTHYSLLRLSEHLLGLPALRNAATAHGAGGFGL